MNSKYTKKNRVKKACIPTQIHGSFCVGLKNCYVCLFVQCKQTNNHQIFLLYNNSVMYMHTQIARNMNERSILSNLDLDHSVIFSFRSEVQFHRSLSFRMSEANRIRLGHAERWNYLFRHFGTERCRSSVGHSSWNYLGPERHMSTWNLLA